MLSCQHFLFLGTASCLSDIIDTVTFLSQGQSCPRGGQQGVPDPHQHRQGWALQSQGHRLRPPENQHTLLIVRLQQKEQRQQQTLMYKGSTHHVHLWWVIYCTQVLWHADAFPTCFAAMIVAQQPPYRTE